MIVINRKMALGERMNHITRSMGWCLVDLNDRNGDIQMNVTVTVEPIGATETVGSAWSGYQKKVVSFRVASVTTDMAWPWGESHIVSPAVRDWVNSDAGYSELYAAFKGSADEAALKAVADQADADQADADQADADQADADQAELLSFIPYYEGLKAVAIPKAAAETSGSYVKCGYRNNSVDPLYFYTRADAESIPMVASANRVGQVFVSGRRTTMF